MTNHLQELGPDALRAVAAAEAEAIAMRHGQLGTGHLLLGLLADEASSARRWLSEAGATLAAVRHKVRDALPPAADGNLPPGRPLAMTPRADRALGRAVRYSHQQRAENVTGEYLLWGVLDVEGTAGQVLRVLGVDVDRLRRELETRGPAAITTSADAHPLPGPLRCPACGIDLDGNVAYRAVEAVGEHGPRRAYVFSCGGCGHVLGVTAG